MNQPHTADPSIWYDKNKGIHEALRRTVADFTHDILKRQGLKKRSDYVFAEFKIKSKGSFRRKMNKVNPEGRRKYSDPREITDLVRVFHLRY